MAKTPYPIFIAWHPNDQDLGDVLHVHLQGTFLNFPHVQFRHPNLISAGEEKAQFITRELQQAKVILLMISARFVVQSEEYWKLACSLHGDPNADTRIVPIYTSTFNYSGMNLDQLAGVEVLPSPQWPLNSQHWGTLENSCTKVANAILQLFLFQEGQQRLKERPAREVAKFAQLLSKLNYSVQPDEFLEAQLLSQASFQSNKAFAYLIKGKYHYGQDWLYQLLRQRIKASSVWEELTETDDILYREISISFSSLTSKSNPDRLWTDLGKTLGIGSFATSQDVVETICNRLASTQIVIFRFDDFDQMSKEMGQQFILDFWQKIVEGAEAPLPARTPYPIFLFLIDNEGDSDPCPDTFVGSSSPDWTPQKAVALTEIDPLTVDDIGTWFFKNRIAINKFDPQLFQTITQKDNRLALSQELIQEARDGLPELVLEKVSEKFNFRFTKIKGQLAKDE